MFLDDFYTLADERLCIAAEQASQFAKQMAGDYNPIHDPEARRFCVPGDLLFALVLARHGLSQRMTFHFRGMVGADVPLTIREDEDGTLSIVDDAGKEYLCVERSGEATRDPVVIEAFTRRYIAFSGRNFPHYLQPLMETQGVMFNPQRPLVIYDSMGFILDSLDVASLDVEFAGSSFEVNGKRGEALLEFRMLSGGEAVGSGSKKLVVSGLQPYDAEVMDAFVEDFNRRKRDYDVTV
ncbi:DUF3581 domain-containing protein [Halomonas sp. McH1-25]|uniref:DUF3581 domain-containing protein n=1 Tax=unclassified Halomonas TaxID=2609666 RepID=UPI001EF58C6D|nr:MULTISPECIES: DUF3581 domain-containing protein [unclassified Halomonas]MCG7599354.1 DUF3581 domain-containing protein [Halomonas sp. McH1-25]MCP1343820.1 DUF3581 domain-containing protein [Halomonas sp. FL8]MCP1361135.1 DUF3581 domain-containing protein [Halomonas sp. BBD45]MCP1363906.1 DUF3581 domain-containing protein [Halomonas sp. BBD48]